MRIDRVRLTHVRIPLHEPFRISSGAVSEKDSILVEVGAGGLSGVGESSPMAGAFYSSETPESCWRDLHEVIIPAMRKQDCGSVEEWNIALEPLPAGNFAKTGFETALWDLECKRAGKPLHAMLGG